MYRFFTYAGNKTAFSDDFTYYFRNSLSGNERSLLVFD